MQNLLMLGCAMAVLALGACASADTKSGGKPTLEQMLAERGYKLGNEVGDISNYRIDGWHGVDDEHLIIDAGAHRDYLVTVRPPCHALMTAERIGFTSTVTKLTRLDQIVVEDVGFSNRCPIQTLHQLERIKQKSQN